MMMICGADDDHNDVYENDGDDINKNECNNDE